MGFGAAGFGMLVGLIVFILGKPLLLGQGEPPKLLEKSREFYTLCRWFSCSWLHVGV